MATLDRFLEAQATVYNTALTEMRRGRKHGHWMWFVFPQLKGLGYSPTAVFYGLEDFAEACAYWQHPLLSRRLLDITSAVNSQSVHSAEALFGYPDNLKFHSCMTLFHQVSPDTESFTEALQLFFNGQQDQHTLALLKG